ncbi:Polycomb protein suz12 [Amphibalanus amphitrite]|uniref:Polycomb protein suz12 n=1 Tax=Amphibalanus amphitrite TaxID=1232801 RepID=A0A6A4VLF9_AMPAM|nr:Polycomb protein suz12 [Amphibalanus amphitrite]
MITKCSYKPLKPLFLHRNLLYMRRASARRVKPKVTRVNALLAMAEKKQSDLTNCTPGQYLTISHIGYYVSKDDSPPSSVRVEVSLKKLCHKRRKEGAAPAVTTSFGWTEVVVNPSDASAPPTVPTSCVPAESFSTQNGSGPKTFVLVVRVSPQQGNRENEEPNNKRRKVSRSSSAASSEPLRAELPVTDRAGRCLLTDGEYDVLLTAEPAGQPTAAASATPGRPGANSPRKTSWESFDDGKPVPVPLDAFSTAPTLKLRLAWTNQPPQPTVERPRPLQARDTNQPASAVAKRCGRGTVKKEESSSSANSRESWSVDKDRPPAGAGSPPTPPLILYQFIYGPAARQQTEARQDLLCPWCCLDCGKLYPLLKHLQLCHARFTFCYTPFARGARIDVSLNESYDSSYAGNPLDLTRPPGARCGPGRRTPSTSVLVCRPRRQKPSLAEFQQTETEERMRPFVTGHNRMYHRTATNLAIPPAELGYDSEGEHDHPWLRTKTRRMIYEFSDVNEGEKALMVMWNLHVMKYNFVGDLQMPQALAMFIEQHGATIVNRNLYRNFVLHLASLYDFGVISPGHIHRAIQQFQELVEGDGDLTSTLVNNLLGAAS